jgi:hypothetical protein
MTIICEDDDDMRKDISLKEFCDLGLLQEINRTMLHPMGLSLYVTVEEVSGDVRFGGIEDLRDDPEGVCFADNFEEFSRTKEESVFVMLNSKKEVREKSLGYFIQPTPEPKK